MWALKRKIGILLVFIIILGLFGFFIYRAFFVKVPTCFDKKRNGTETGVDCGGSCEQVCKVLATNVNIIWAKTFEVSGGVSNIAALIENPNFDFDMSAIYNIKIFDEDGIRIKDFKKKIKLNSGEKRLIFIPSVITGKRKAVQTFIDFENIESLVVTNIRDNKLTVISKIITNESGKTRLSVGVKNMGLRFQRDIEVSAVLKDKNGIVIDVGKTYIDYIDKRKEENVNITWPKEFDDQNILIDIYLRKVDF